MKIRALYYGVMCFVLTTVIVACRPRVEENATFLQDSAIFNNSGRGRAIANATGGDRAEIMRISDEMCYVRVDKDEGWAECQYLSIDEGAVYVDSSLSSGSSQNRNICTLTAYRSDAQPLMNRLGQLSQDVSLRDINSLRSTLSQLDSLQGEVNRLPCKSTFPLKHETLEYAVKHTRDAVAYAQEGEYVRANQALDRAIINVERFNDWSLDVSPNR